MEIEYSKDSDLFKLLTSPEGHEQYNCAAIYTDDHYNDTFYTDEVYDVEDGEYKGYWRIDQDSDCCYLVEPYEVVETHWKKVEA